MSGLIDDLRQSWNNLFTTYGFRVVSIDIQMVYVVVSTSVVMIVCRHPSAGGLELRWVEKTKNGWLSYAALNFLWTRSRAKPDETSILENELKTLAWKLQEAGQDMLNGSSAWKTEYERQTA